MEHSYSVRTGRAVTSCSRIQSRANPGGMLRKRVLNKTLVATLADELRIADELGVAWVSAGDGGVVW